MPTRHVVLTERQDALIEALVESGRYQNASEVLREGLRLIETREAENAAKLGALRTAALVGTAAIDQGDERTFATVTDLGHHLDELADLVF
jgi:antitoxin ParD1/3/4